MTQLKLNDKARDAIKRSLETTNFTEKRQHLGTAIFAMKPDPEARMKRAASFGGLIDDMLMLDESSLEMAVDEAARQVWA